MFTGRLQGAEGVFTEYLQGYVRGVYKVLMGHPGNLAVMAFYGTL